MPAVWPLAVASWIGLLGGLYYIADCKPPLAAAWFCGNVFVNTVSFTCIAVAQFVRVRREKARL